MKTDDLNLIILDVRTPDEYNQSHLKNAVLIDFYSADFSKKIAELDKNKIYKLYCRSGNRSGQATEYMKLMGFQKVENVGSLEQASNALNIECVR